jgi:hypothetical protein
MPQSPLAVPAMAEPPIAVLSTLIALLPMPQAVLPVPSPIREPTLAFYPARLYRPLPEAIRVVSGLCQRRLSSAFDFVLNQLKQLRFGLSGPVLPLFDRSLECVDAIFGRL